MKNEINITREQFFNFVKNPEETEEKVSATTQPYFTLALWKELVP